MGQNKYAMKRFLFLLLICVSVSSYAGSLVVYPTYEDYKKNKGQKYEIFVGMSSLFGKYRVVVRKAGADVKLKCEEMWGFKVDEDLFRTTSGGLYLKLSGQGKLFYFENGEAYLSDGVFVKGNYNYISTTIDGELTPIPTDGAGGNIKARYDKFKTEHPEFNQFYECFEKNPNLDNCRDCMDKFLNPGRVRIFENYKEP